MDFRILKACRDVCMYVHVSITRTQKRVVAQRRPLSLSLSFSHSLLSSREREKWREVMLIYF